MDETEAKPAQPAKGPVDPIAADDASKPAIPLQNGSDIAGATQSLKDGATKLMGDAGDRARTYAEEGKARAGGALDELSRMMNQAAGTVDEKLGEQYGKYARSAADAVANFSGSLKSKNVDDLVEDARNLVKKSPAIAIGTAAALGFVLARLLKSGIDAKNDDA